MGNQTVIITIVPAVSARFFGDFESLATPETAQPNDSPHLTNPHSSTFGGLA